MTGQSTVGPFGTLLLWLGELSGIVFESFEMVFQA
jgi:hypothetical protein